MVTPAPVNTSQRTHAPRSTLGTYERGRPGRTRDFSHFSQSEYRSQLRHCLTAVRSSRWEAAEVIHLHHLTPLHPATFRAFPTTPVLTHLHGTELKFLERLRGDALGEAWIRRMTRWAAASSILVCPSTYIRSRASELLSLPESRLEVVPNGVDTARFRPESGASSIEVEDWVRWLSTDPQGWDSSGRVGSISYSRNDVEAKFAAIRTTGLILFVGRFLDFKGIPHLLDSFKLAQGRGLAAPLVIWGGSPGEWDGEHPFDYCRRNDISNVYFVGWRNHTDLSLAMSAISVMAAPSVNEPFGLVYLEAMAAGVPVIATNSGGPRDLFPPNAPNPGGWLVEPGNRGALASVLIEAVVDQEGTRRRGNAARLVADQYSWEATARRLAEIYQLVARPVSGGQPSQANGASPGRARAEAPLE